MPTKQTAAKGLVPASRPSEMGLSYIQPTIGKIYRIGFTDGDKKKYLICGKPEFPGYTDPDLFVFHSANPALSTFIIANTNWLRSNIGGVVFRHPSTVLMTSTDNKGAALFSPSTEGTKGVWQLEDAGDKKFRLWNPEAASYAYRDVTGWNVHYLALGDKRDDGKDIFFLEEAGEYKEITSLRKLDLPTFKTPELKSIDPPGAFTPEVVCGEVAVPWFMVKEDSGKDDDWRAENTPYYIMRRWSRWEARNFEVYPKKTQKEHTWSVVWGVTKEKGKDIDQKFNVSVNSEGGLDLKAFSGKFSYSLSYSLGIKTYERETNSYSHSDGGKDTMGPYDDDTAVCEFYRQDVYRLYRTGGQYFYDFPLTVPGTKASRTYTKKTTTRAR